MKSKRMMSVLLTIALSMVLVMGFGATAFAADTDNIPKEGVRYTLTYPDGITITENSEGAPLKYADVQKAMKEENWFLVATGLKSDANGKIVLPANLKEGTIRIVETVVPDGYKAGPDTEKIADLEDGSVEIVNYKSGAPGTGDTVNLLPLSLLLFAAVTSLLILVKRGRAAVNSDGSAGFGRVNKALFVTLIIGAGVLMAASAYAADGFTINKVDENGEPVEGAEFEVYGKPTVTYEKISEATIDIKLTKTWDDESNKDGIRPDAEAFKKYINLSYTVDGSTDDIAITDPAPKVTDNGDNTYTVIWEDVRIYDDNGAERFFGVGETEIEGYDLGEITGDVKSGYEVTNTHKPQTTSMEISVGMNYRIYNGGAWGDVVNGAETVTVSGNGMTETPVSFTPGDKGPKKVKVPGPGKYTVRMNTISKANLQDEAKLATLRDATGSNPMPIIIDTVSTTVTVDKDGNCTVSDTTFSSFAFGLDGHEKIVYNDIPALKEAYLGTGADTRLDKLNPHSDLAGASASGSTVTLTAVMSQGWDDSTDITVK